MRCHLGSCVQKLKQLKILDIINFPFLTRPSEDAIVAAEKELFLFGAVDKEIGVHNACIRTRARKRT